VVDDGVVRERSSGVLAERPIALPMLDVHTVGAGGGSIAWRDAGGALRVGPRSAGADPGPASYGRGGSEPTVTDANLLLGYLSADDPLAGGVALDRDAAERAIKGLADELGLDLVACAEGILRVANAEMVRALRVITVERGVDPRRYALLAFGGAGPLHAAAIADELGITTIVCPRASGVLAALGLIVAPRRRDAQRTVFLSGEALTEEGVRDTVGELGDQARRALEEPEAELSAVYELRYRGQAFELAVAAGVAPTPEELREAFEAEHEERYGYRDADQELELVTIRVAATLAGAEPSLTVAGDPETAGDPTTSEREPPRAGARQATLDAEELDLNILKSPPPGTPVRGPAVVELPEATLLVPPHWAGIVDEAGTIRIERER
jgi:N-methylhydantoinase A